MKDQIFPASDKNIATGKFSRRKFLAGAGASALALPFIKSWPALGQATTTDPNEPNPWLMRGCNVNAIPGMLAHNIPVTGVRHYCEANNVPSQWPAPPGTVAAGSNSECSWPGGTVTIPNLDDVSMCVTIYPLVNRLLKQGMYAGTNGYDDELHLLMSTTQAREMLSCWHEASNVKTDGDGVTITPQLQQQMQVYLHNFAKTGNGNTTPSPMQILTPLYKCAVGAVDIGDWARASPYMAPGLDFYGIDLYHKQFSDPTVPLEEWRQHVYGTSTIAAHSPNATISVCECNCDLDADRACYFYTTAKWVWNQTNRGARSFLCFWNGPFELGGCWPPGPAAIAQLKRIGNQDYSNPDGCPEP
jgi:hypothetical protein